MSAAERQKADAYGETWRQVCIEVRRSAGYMRQVMLNSQTYRCVVACKKIKMASNMYFNEMAHKINVISFLC